MREEQILFLHIAPWESQALGDTGRQHPQAEALTCLFPEPSLTLRYGASISLSVPWHSDPPRIPILPSLLRGEP